MLVAVCGAGAPASEHGRAVELTVYNQGMGLVKDQRTLDLAEGVAEVRLDDVAALVDPTSVRFRSLDSPDAVAVLEQSFRFDVVDGYALLDRYVGKEISLERAGVDGRVAGVDRVTLLSGPRASQPAGYGGYGVQGGRPPGWYFAPLRVDRVGQLLGDGDASGLAAMGRGLGAGYGSGRSPYRGAPYGGYTSGRRPLTYGAVPTNRLVVSRDGAVVLDPPGTVKLPDLGDELLVRPTLVWLLRSTQAGRQPCEVSYITEGLTWTAEYVATLTEDDTRMDLDGWVTLDNRSGATYPDAKLKLVAGDVARVRGQDPRISGGIEVGVYDRAPATGEGFAEESLFEYHLYELERPTTVADREAKQVQLLSAPEVTVAKRYVYDPEIAPMWMTPGADASKTVMVKVEFVNGEQGGLGVPLPAGRVRLMKADAEGALQFIGEDDIDHTPRGEAVRLHVGTAFDLVGELTKTGHHGGAEGWERNTYIVSLRNHKDEPVQITSAKHFRGEWEIVDSTHEWVKTDARTAEFTVAIPARGEVRIRFTAADWWTAVGGRAEKADRARHAASDGSGMLGGGQMGAGSPLERLGGGGLTGKGEER